MQQLNRLAQYKFHFLLFFLSFFLLTSFAVDADLGWHIAYGRAFLRGFGIIAYDPFSWSMKGHFWANSYFFYQIMVAWLFDKLGYLTTVFLFGILMTFSVIFLLPRKINLLVALASCLGFFLALAGAGIRPHVFDFLYFAILLFLVERKAYKQVKFVAFWFLFFALWANFHVGFLVGILTFSGFIVLDCLRRRKFDAGSVLLLSAAILGTIATPFNFQIWRAIFFDSTSSLGLLYVYEWQPVVFSVKFALPYVLSGLIFVYVFRRNVRKIEPEWLLSGAVLFMLPILSSFYLIFWAEYFIFIVSRYFDFRNKLLEYFALVALVALVLGAVFNFGRQLDKSWTLKERFVTDGYPVLAMNFIVSHGYSDRLFNHFNWGGFIDWQYADVPVFIDGRMNGWRGSDGKYIFDDFIQIVRGKCDSFSRYQPKVALLTPSSSEKCFRGWKTVYSDSVSKVLVVPE